MGVLDPLSDPSTMGILALAGGYLANAGPSRTPVSTSSALGHGFQGMQEAIMKARQIEMLRQQQLAQQQHMTMQNQLIQQQVAQHAADLKNQEGMRTALAALGPDATSEAMSKAVLPFAKPGELITNFNTQSKNDLTKQIAFERASRQAQKDLTDLQFKERAAKSQEEKQHWQQQIDSVRMQFQKQAADIAAGRYQYDTGNTVQPFQGTIPQPAPNLSQPQPSVATNQGMREAVAGLPINPSGEPAFGASPQNLNAQGAPIAAPQQDPMAPINPRIQAAPSNFDAKDLLMRAAQSQPAPVPSVAPQPMDTPMAQRQPVVALSPRNQQAVEVARQKAEATAPPEIQGDALEMAAERYKLDGTLPTNLGRGQQGSRNTIKILDRAAALAKEAGDTAEEIRIKQIGVKAKAVALNANTKDLTAIRPYNEMLEKNGDIAIDLASKAIATNSQFANRPINWLRMNASDNPAVAEFLAQARIVSTEAARVLNNPRLVGELTDTARKDMDLVINGNMPLNAFSTVVRRMQQDGKNRVNAMINENERLTQSLGRGANQSRPEGQNRRASDGTPPLVQKGEVVDGWEYIGPNSDSKADRANRMNWRKKQ